MGSADGASVGWVVALSGSGVAGRADAVGLAEVAGAGGASFVSDRFSAAVAVDFDLAFTTSEGGLRPEVTIAMTSKVTATAATTTATASFVETPCFPIAGASSIGASAIGTAAIVAVAIGAVAIGAVAVGAIAATPIRAASIGSREPRMTGATMGALTCPLRGSTGVASVANVLADATGGGVAERGRSSGAVMDGDAVGDGGGVAWDSIVRAIGGGGDACADASVRMGGGGRAGGGAAAPLAAGTAVIGAVRDMGDTLGPSGADFVAGVVLMGDVTKAGATEAAEGVRASGGSTFAAGGACGVRSAFGGGRG
jgi:hypothetical protein